MNHSLRSITPVADWLIATIQFLFPKGTPQVQGKVFAVSVRIEAAGDTEFAGKAHRGYVHLALIADRNYVKVFAAQSKCSLPFLRITEWELICDHDSAWRDDGVRSALQAAYRSVAAEAGRALQCPDRAPGVAVSLDNMGILPRAEVFGAELPSDVQEALAN